MAESVAQIRNRIRPPRRLRLVARPATAEDTSFLLESEGGRVVISTPIETADWRADAFYMDLSGRLVEAEHANRNGAFWAQQDLEFGLPSVAFGPLNWGHDEKDIVGTLINPSLVTAEQAALESVGPYIRTGSRFWSYLNPERARLLDQEINAGRAFYSMECIASKIQCVGPNGCGAVMPYGDAQRRTGAACVHVKERASHRRFIEPIFQGAAIIVPPSAPGWANASIGRADRQAAEEQVEAAGLEIPSLTHDEAAQMVASIARWANR